MIGKALVSMLSGTATVYPLRAAQGATLPLVTYQITNNYLANEPLAKAGVRRVDVQLNVIATTYDAADTLAWAIINKINKVSGSYGSETIKDVRHEGGPDDLYQDDADVYGKAIDISIWVKN